MGSEKFVIQAGNGAVWGIGNKNVGVGIGVCVGNGVIVGSAVDVSVGVLAGSAGMGLPIAQAEVIIIVPAEKNKSFASLIFLISWKTNLEILL